MPASVPEGYTALGFVGFTDKGDYKANESYMTNDLVHLNNDIWKCLADNTSGVTPGTSAAATKWGIFISGEKIIYKSSGNFPTTGDVNKFYVDDTVAPRIIYTWDSSKSSYVVTGGSGGGDIDISEENVTFTEPSTYTKPVSGHPLKEFAGRVVKGLSVLFSNVGTLSSLKTTAKSSLVAAANELFDKKFDKSKIIASTNITESGYVMDGAKCSEALAELYSNSGGASKILWENPNPSEKFAAQTITLNSTDFDCYEVFTLRGNTATLVVSGKSLINHGIYLTTSDSGYKIFARQFNWVAPNKLQIGNASYEGSSAAANETLVPIKIIGYKL